MDKKEGIVISEKDYKELVKLLNESDELTADIEKRTKRIMSSINKVEKHLGNMQKGIEALKRLEDKLASPPPPEGGGSRTEVS